MRAIVFRHIDGDDLGRFAAFFAEDGIAYDVVDLHNGQPIPDLAPYDIMLALGGPQQVWEEDEHPWLREEKQAIREWVGERAKPYIGICFGHQLLASAFGGEVGLASRPEIGLNRITFAEEAADCPMFGGLAASSRVLQWHYAEVKAPPREARVLAGSDVTQVQAITIGDHALGAQFHFEWTFEVLRGWARFPNWISSLEGSLGQGAHPRMLADCEPHMPAIGATSNRIYSNFKRQAGLARLTP